MTRRLQFLPAVMSWFTNFRFAVKLITWNSQAENHWTEAWEIFWTNCNESLSDDVIKLIRNLTNKITLLIRTNGLWSWFKSLWHLEFEIFHDFAQFLLILKNIFFWMSRDELGDEKNINNNLLRRCCRKIRRKEMHDVSCLFRFTQWNILELNVMRIWVRFESLMSPWMTQIPDCPIWATQNISKIISAKRITKFNPQN